ncbi:MAG: type III pantothenate kinase [Halochromatium sp.]|nr:type III pantothenate kinase [Halochromatium sp.]
MKLLIEIGNTSLKWALLQGEAGLPGPMAAARHFGALPIDVLASWDQLGGVERVLVASVGPDTVLDAVKTAVAAYWQCPLTPIETSAEALGVRVAYAEPERLGVDRFLALIGAHWLAGRPDLLTGALEQVKPEPELTYKPKPRGGFSSDHVPAVKPTVSPSPERPLPRHSETPESGCATLIIDAGTAITFDALLADGRHRGGQIMPGISMLRESLLRGTRLPPHQTLDQHDPWGIDTGPAIAAASLQAPAALAERLRSVLHQETGKIPRLLMTGGDAGRLAPLLDQTVHLQPDLVLIGLSRFA